MKDYQTFLSFIATKRRISPLNAILVTARSQKGNGAFYFPLYSQPSILI